MSSVTAEQLIKAMVKVDSYLPMPRSFHPRNMNEMLINGELNYLSGNDELFLPALSGRDHNLFEMICSGESTVFFFLTNDCLQIKGHEIDSHDLQMYCGSLKYEARFRVSDEFIVDKLADSIIDALDSQLSKDYDNELRRKQRLEKLNWITNKRLELIKE